jgi:ParB family transcriptional regulator, chromosome partitioning protein
MQFIIQELIMTEQAKHAPAPEAAFAFITLEQLGPNTYNARRFTENMTPQRQAKFDELTGSVREKGIIEPLLVRPLDGDRYEIIAGERRYRAALRAAFEQGIEPEDYKAPCMVKHVTDDEAFDLMIIENLHRDDLTPFETAQAFRDYLTRHANRTDAIAELSMRTGIPGHTIRRQVRLLELPAAVLAAWNEGAITQSHAEMLTRLDDDAQVLELLANCVRLKLSTRELAERIGSISPDLEKAFFDKGECQVCASNTSVQSGLFAAAAAGGKCGNAVCFEKKQGEFFAANWLNSKAAAEFGTRGYRFGHRLGQERCEQLLHVAVAERCQACDQFITVLRLNGAVVSGYAQCCTGPVACFEELYRNRETEDVRSETETRTDETDKTEVKEKPEIPPTKTARASLLIPAEQKPAAPPAKTKPQPPEETGPVYDARRGERFRKEFVRSALLDMEKKDSAQVLLRFGMLALVLASNPAKAHLIKGLALPNNIRPDKLAEAVFNIPEAHVANWLYQLATSHVMNDFAPEIWQLAAVCFGIDVARTWTITKDYLESMTKSEIIRIGEEPGVGIWKDEKAEAYRTEHHQGKALLSLKKDELIDIILKSGAELTGRVPAEVLGVKQG